MIFEQLSVVAGTVGSEEYPEEIRWNRQIMSRA